MKKLFIIDGSSFLYRAYYALKPMHTPQGVPVGAVYGFCRMLKKLIDTQQPHHILIAWDSKGETERHKLLASYKETRLAVPSDLHVQKEMIQEFATIIGMRQVQQPGIEADDIMYSLGMDFTKQDFSVVLVTSDKDMGQMVTDSTVIYDTFKDAWYDEKALEEKYGFSPVKLPFYFALVGDTSDNIPGVSGIGPKGATELVQQFAGLHDLYEHLDAVKKPRTQELLRANKNNAFLSEQLFLLRYYDFGITAAQCTFEAEQWNRAQEFFKRLQFKSLIQETQGSQDSLEASLPAFLSTTHGFTFIPLTTKEAIQELCTAIKKTGFCAVDTETDGAPAYAAQLVGMSFAYEVGTAYYIPIAHTTGTNIAPDIVMHYLKPLLEDPQIEKYLHNSKFDELVLARAGITLTGVTFDTIIATDLTVPDWQKINLKAISSAYLGQEMLTYKDVMKRGKFKTFADVPLDLATEYGASDAHQVLQLVPLLRKKLHDEGVAKLFETIEMPLVATLVAMEKEGIIVDTTLLAHLSDVAGKTLERIRTDIVTLSGPEYETINLNAPRQIEELLFTKLQLTPLKKTSKKTGYSTDHEVLSGLARQHPVPELIIKHRELSKLKSTYLDALPTYVNPYTGRIHTSFNQTGTATGRLASSDPNLQNIPVASGVEGLSIRSAFKAPEGHLFVSADYSQIELRVLAHLSKDQALCQAFLRQEDIHARTAAGLFDVALSDVSHAQRQLGKRINFSILYGLTAYGLSKDLGITYADAEKYIDRYFEQYPGVAQWIEQVIEQTKEQGYVTTEWGRKRFIPGIYEKNRTLYEMACRVAVNTKAQGTAADIMKIGMNTLYDHFVTRNNQEKIILQIHDELLITTPIETVAQTERDVVRILQGVTHDIATPWDIPLVVTTRHGRDWHEVTK